MKKLAIYALCACLAQPIMVQADTDSAQATIDAIEYESELIRQAEESGQDENREYAVLYSEYEADETADGAEISSAAEEETTEDDAEIAANPETAAKSAPSKKTVTLYSAKDRCWVGNTKQIKNRNVLCVVKGKVTDLKTRNKAVAKLLTTTSRGYTTVYVKPGKEGTVVVSFKQGKKTYKTKITVKKYVNPVKQVKIGSVVQSGNVFASSSIMKADCGSNLGKKTPVAVSLADGWELSSMNFVQKNTSVSVSMKNGNSVMIQKGLVVSAVVKNKSTKQSEEITIRFV